MEKKARRRPRPFGPGRLLSRLGYGRQVGVPAPLIHFIAVEPVELSVDLSLPAVLAEGDALPARVSVAGNLDAPAEGVLASTLSVGTCRPASFQLALAPGRQGVVNLSLALPWEPGRYELTVTATVGGREVAAARALAAEWVYPTVLDLMDPDVGLARGFRARVDAQETEGIPAIYFGEYELTRPSPTAHPHREQ